MKPYRIMSKVPKTHPACENARGSESMPMPSNRPVALNSWLKENGQILQRGWEKSDLLSD
jgi:hypothetical protein